MFNINTFLKRYDALFQQGRSDLVEQYLLDGLEMAQNENDYYSVFTILNELLGYYRVHGLKRQCLDCIDMTLQVADILQIQGTREYAIMLINVATAYRICKEYTKSLQCYMDALSILKDNDYEKASLYNNLSLLYMEMQEYEKAYDSLHKAMDILIQYEYPIEVATTHVNMGNLCYYQGYYVKGIHHMEQAISIFENQSSINSHYSSALSGMAEGYFHLKEYEKSLDYYDKALKEIERVYGINIEYKKVSRNRDLVQSMIDKSKDLISIERIENYFNNHFLELLETKYKDYKIAAGLIGEGSQCYGYDDMYSTDHDYGLGFCLWMDEDTYSQIKDSIIQDYETIVRKPIKHRTGVLVINDFIKQLIGKYPETLNDWLDIKDEQLSTITNGKIFYDPHNIMIDRISYLKTYPKKVKLSKLSKSLHDMAQSGQYNYIRCMKRKDKGALSLTKSLFIESTIQTAYLLNDLYKPFYKWAFKKMDEFTKLTDIKEMVLTLIDMDLEDIHALEQIESICNGISKELHTLGYQSNNSFLESYSKMIMESLHGNNQ
ncbi:MAG: DUF4037 domain-containing protein [Holdemanella sp.]|nr:DUF4037 domain-containing protein [Holdemanella sp.]